MVDEILEPHPDSPLPWKVIQPNQEAVEQEVYAIYDANDQQVISTDWGVLTREDADFVAQTCNEYFLLVRFNMHLRDALLEIQRMGVESITDENPKEFLQAALSVVDEALQFDIDDEIPEEAFDEEALAAANDEDDDLTEYTYE